MKSRGKGGSIVNISSQTAMIAIENHATYSASKGALDQLTKVMALELAPYQVMNPNFHFSQLVRFFQVLSKYYFVFICTEKESFCFSDFFFTPFMCRIQKFIF